MTESMNLERPKKSLTARLLPLLILLVVAVFGFQYALLVSNETQAVRRAQQEDAARTKTHEEPLPDALAVAGASPRETTLKVIEDLKRTEDPRAALQYVWWDGAFQLLTEAQKESFHIRSPRALFDFYNDSYRSPSSVFLRQMENDLEKAPETKRAALAEFVKTQRMAEGKPTPFTELKGKLLEITKETSEAGTAEAELRITEGANSKTLPLRFIEVNSKWLFACVQIVPDPLGLCKQK